MTRRITFDLDEAAFPWLMGFIATMEHALHIAIKVSMKELDEAGAMVGPNGGDRSTVKYATLGGRDALTALGESTIIGLIFAHLLDHGPQTAKEIGQGKPFNKKTIEASLWRLRHQGLITAEEIGQ